MADINATDAAQEKADAFGVDLAEVAGTGQEGKVTADDVDRAAGDGQADNAKFVTLDPVFGVGEYVVSGDSEQRFISGVPKPISDSEFNELTNEDGELAYPLIEKKGD